MDSKEEKRANGNPTTNTNGWRPKGQEGKEGKCGYKAVKFSCLEMGECDPPIEEIPANEVNVATGQINLPNALGVIDWEWGNWAKKWSSIIDTGFYGRGLRSYALLRRCDGYLRIFIINQIWWIPKQGNRYLRLWIIKDGRRVLVLPYPYGWVVLLNQYVLD